MKCFLQKFFPYLLIFALFFVIFYVLQFSFSGLAGFDAYYHIKQAKLIRIQGPSAAKNFPWLQQTILKEHPGDPWLGFHLFLLPFTFGDLTEGAKWSAVFAGALFFSGFFLILKQFKVKHSFFWTIFLFLISVNFIQRLLMARPGVFAVFFALLAVYFISQKKHYCLLGLSFISGFMVLEAPLLALMSFLFGLIDWLKTKKIDKKLFLFPVIGLFLGLAIRPDFPNNLFLLFQMSFGVLLLRLKGVNLNFGAELSNSFTGLVKDNVFLFLSSIIPIYYIFFQFLKKKQKKISSLYLFLFCLVFGFAGLSLAKANRFIEYWVPLTVLFSAVFYTDFLLPTAVQVFKGVKNYQGFYLSFTWQKPSLIYQKLYRLTRTIFVFFERKSAKFCLLACFILLLSYFAVRQIIFVFSFSRPSFSESYKEAVGWLAENTAFNSLVLNQPWHTFAPLFFYNHHNFYAFGMDPAITYFKNNNLYWLWRNIIEKGIICNQEKCLEPEINKDRAYEILKYELKGDYLFLENQPSCSFVEDENSKDKYSQFRNLLNPEKFEKVFAHGKIEIYQIK